MIVDRLCIASHNLGKIREIKQLLLPYNVEVVSAQEMGCPDVLETGSSFEENAMLKATAVFETTGITALADDSGLCVDALDGRPGIYSARYADGDFSKGCHKLWQEMQPELANGKPETASFHCVLALVTKHEALTFAGKVDGKIVWPMRGNAGFGYDPIFLKNGDNKTYGEISPQEKHKDSHRGRAFNKLLDYWQNHCK